MRDPGDGETEDGSTVLDEWTVNLRVPARLPIEVAKHLRAWVDAELARLVVAFLAHNADVLAEAGGPRLEISPRPLGR